ncbi:hypothetical protein PM082_009715 [Marasmius tenuissimus]|nr:hypothetical protein PM082_009715 [Marasmius tenuissimus]
MNNDTTEYVGGPSPELDRRWDDLYRFPTIRIPSDPDNYIVALDVFHQVHCLNMLRKGLRPDYYPPVEDWHVQHCIEHLRQAILCSSDVSLIIYHWNYEQNSTYGRSATPHTCRNFDTIYEWAKDPKNNLPLNEFDATVKPPGA